MDVAAEVEENLFAVSDAKVWIYMLNCFGNSNALCNLTNTGFCCSYMDKCARLFL